MASNDSSVGKRIVEALKMQNGEVIENNSSLDSSEMLKDSFDNNNSYKDPFDDFDDFSITEDESSFSNSQTYGDTSSLSIESAFQQSLNQNIGYTASDIPDDFEFPANVAILKQLVAKLPQGVSKQMGAKIIKQTLEAVGIPMSGVLEEARQVQNALSEQARNCQSSIIECRKQIGIFETKAKQYQKQFALMNDIINLFIHIN